MVFTIQAESAPVYQDMEIDRGPEKSSVVIQVEVAITPEDRARGLMHRNVLAEDAGMLFVFEKDQILSFWMKDTQIPLSIAFIAADGRILEIRDMEPESRELILSSAPARYALEMNQGWFEKNGIVPGHRVHFFSVQFPVST
ncbi:DUF192 domain-containing protein [Desulfosarcina sp. OttesenSCG-928-B08]|nr:DUF192 domain-containing protein [Desulfosarcina sp. OttesenSCG-928-B08]